MRQIRKKEKKKLSLKVLETTMEIEGEDGTKLFLKPRVKSVFGRGAGFNTEDLTVSRRHVSLEFKPAAGENERSDRVFLEVLGRNPVWVRAGEKGEKIRTYRKSETGEIDTGERFCVSGHHPIWFNLKRRDEVTEERVSEGQSGLDTTYISDIDPVKGFGFLVMGKEFDQYPESRMRDVKQWEWFLEDTKNGNSDDDGDKKGRKGLSKKRRRKKENEDDDWSVESEEDKEMLVKSKRVVRPTYSTRSKKTKKDTNASSSNSSSRAQTKQRGRVDGEDEEEEDETLGGFIVSDEDAKLEEEDESDEEEEVEDDD